MNEAVFEIQSFIRNISKLDSSIPSLIPDGIYGDETAEAVTAFQRSQLIPQTGRVDFNTWEKLFNESEKALFYFSEPTQLAPITNDDLPLKKGKESHLNYNINLMLSRFSDFYKDFDKKSVSYDYTDDTERLVILFQKIAYLDATGEVDKQTWNLLSELYLLLKE